MECFKRCSEVYVACRTGFIAFVEVQERRFTEGVFCFCSVAALGRACRVSTIVTCLLLYLTGWSLNKP